MNDGKTHPYLGKDEVAGDFDSGSPALDKGVGSVHFSSRPQARMRQNYNNEACES